MSVPSSRFIAVASGLASVCAILLLCLAGSQYSDSIFSGQSDRSVLEQAKSVKANEVKQLEAIMLKQQQMEGKEQKLLASIEKGEAHAAKVLETEKKQAVHVAAAYKTQSKAAAHQAKVVAEHKAQAQVHTVAHKAAATKAKMEAVQSVSLSETGSADLGGSPKAADSAADKVAQLKAELAKAEADEKQQKEAKSSTEEQKPAQQAKPEDDKKAAVADKHLLHPVTGKDFLKLPDQVATVKDGKIAKEAGLHPMGWMGSAKSIDNMLRKLNCDPASFVCSGTAAQKKQALAIIKKIQESIMSDSTQVKAYGWKEEHALPPAPHM